VISHEKDFGVMPTEEFQKIVGNWSCCWDDVKEHDGVFYLSKNNVAMLISVLIKDIIKATQLDLETTTGVGAFGLWLDIWLVIWNMIPLAWLRSKSRIKGRKTLARVFWISLLYCPGWTVQLSNAAPNFLWHEPCLWYINYVWGLASLLDTSEGRSHWPDCQDSWVHAYCCIGQEDFATPIYSQQN